MGASSSSSSRSANFSYRSSSKQRSFRNVSNSSFPMQIKHRERQLVAEESVRSPLNRQRCNVNRNAKEFSKFWTRGGSLQPQRQSQRRRGSKRRTHERSVSPFSPDSQDIQRIHPYGWDSMPCSPSLAVTSRSGCDRLQVCQCSRCIHHTTADGIMTFCDDQSTWNHIHPSSCYVQRRRPSQDPPISNQISPIGSNRMRRLSHDSPFLSQTASVGSREPNRLQCSPDHYSFTKFHFNNQLLPNPQQPAVD